MFDILKVKKELKIMEKHLASKSDERLIKGYRDVMRDFKETGNEQLLAVSSIIKNELDKRGLKYE